MLNKVNFRWQAYIQWASSESFPCLLSHSITPMGSLVLFMFKDGTFLFWWIYELSKVYIFFSFIVTAFSLLKRLWSKPSIPIISSKIIQTWIILLSKVEGRSKEDFIGLRRCESLNISLKNIGMISGRTLYMVIKGGHLVNVYRHSSCIRSRPIRSR